MRHNPTHAETDEAVVRELIEANPWATLISRNDDETLVASHYPILLDPDADGLAVVTHVGRPDERVHGFGDREILLIVAGPHGYISPSWYAPQATRAPTWNFSVADCYGVPEMLSAEHNVGTLERLVAHFERHVDRPAWLEPEVAARLAPGTAGIRLAITRFICKVKMSQDTDPQSQRQVLSALRAPGAYANPLADAMVHALGLPDGA
ncbi:MAG: FMN-binding negative transcriptional regulator [Actinomycetota bacterium]|nr:FMN-binding negative transcriptional regulator [Actinomycetota bacterium]